MATEKFLRCRIEKKLVKNDLRILQDEYEWETIPENLTIDVNLPPQIDANETNVLETALNSIETEA